VEIISVGIYWMTSASLAESCQGDRTQRQQSVVKIAKSTVDVHLVWHDISVATEARGQMRAVMCYSVRLRKTDAAMHKYCHNNFPRINKAANEEGLMYSHFSSKIACVCPTVSWVCVDQIFLVTQNS
jgi:hypothetical protein